jgi:hypothetical protein
VFPQANADLLVQFLTVMVVGSVRGDDAHDQWAEVLQYGPERAGVATVEVVDADSRCDLVVSLHSGLA